MPELVLGPMLRYLDDTRATIWAQADEPCRVEVLGAASPTFAVGDRHYAVVTVTGLEPATVTEYDVRLDGERCWPRDDGTPPSTIRSVARDESARIAAGSCRVTAAHEPPYCLEPGDAPEAVGSDALEALARVLATADREQWPHALLLLGDQVYADLDPTGDHPFPMTAFDDHAHLYEAAWSPKWIRWLFSVMPTAMIFDDHEVIDDWNLSEAWVREAQQNDWWPDHVTSALAAYWLYQHLGNLTPEQLEQDDLLDRLHGAEDGTDELLRYAATADRGIESTVGVPWSHARDIGTTRVLVVDSRNGRRLETSDRAMIDEEEMAWVEEHATGDFEHLVLASSVPFLLPPGVHEAERWSEAVTEGGAWGRRWRGWGEKVRRALDLEHWAAFGRSFEWLEDLLRRIGSGRHRPEGAPATVTLVSGDVHFHYVAPARFVDAPEATSRINQVVTSPLRHAVDARERRALRTADSLVGRVLGRSARRLARAPRSSLRWSVEHGPMTVNGLAVLAYDGPSAEVTFWCVPWGHEELEPVLSVDLVG